MRKSLLKTAVADWEKQKSFPNFERLNSSTKTTISLTMSSEKKAVDLGLLEEDDEFEEFPADGEILLEKFVKLQHS